MFGCMEGGSTEYLKWIGERPVCKEGVGRNMAGWRLENGCMVGGSGSMNGISGCMEGER